eukprot:360958-Chlamydomonas_euryale.AAC.6
MKAADCTLAQEPSPHQLGVMTAAAASSSLLPPARTQNSAPPLAVRADLRPPLNPSPPDLPPFASTRRRAFVRANGRGHTRGAGARI